MDRNKLRRHLKIDKNTKSFFYYILKKFYKEKKDLTEEEKSNLLYFAIILIKDKFMREDENRYIFELAYSILLEYSLIYEDYDALYDFSINAGFFPISNTIISMKEYIKRDTIQDIFIKSMIHESYKEGNMVQLLSQRNSMEKVINREELELGFIAPTSYGKSLLIYNDIKNNIMRKKHFAIIVPTKSLLNQTSIEVKKIIKEYPGEDIKIVKHNEMFLTNYNNIPRKTICVLTQERALRILEDNPTFSFEHMYIDEAHNLFNNDHRNILLARLIRINKRRNRQCKILYLSPLIEDVSNLAMDEKQNIEEVRIDYNIKEPRYYLVCDKKKYRYNRFINEFFKVEDKSYKCEFEYISHHSGDRNFCFLRRPSAVEGFAKGLQTYLSKDISANLVKDNVIDEIIEMLKKYVHEEYYLIDCLKYGVIYLHGNINDGIKQYLEYKYKKIHSFKYLVANQVILEGVNLPIDTLFILHVHSISEKQFINLIGRVNRLGEIFNNEIVDLDKLMPKIHFINNRYTAESSTDNSFKNKIKGIFASASRADVNIDKVNNPMLKLSSSKHSKKETIIIEEEDFIFSNPENIQEQIKKRLIELGISNNYNHLDNRLINKIYENILFVKERNKINQGKTLDKLYKVFIKNFNFENMSDEFARLRHVETRNFYDLYINKYIPRSFKDKVKMQYNYMMDLKDKNEQFFYMGHAYGDTTYFGGTQKVYINLENKNKKEIINYAICKIKLEDDFFNYKLKPIIKFMYEYEIISENEYNYIFYGTKKLEEIRLIKTGLRMDILSIFKENKLLEYLSFNEDGSISIMTGKEKEFNKIIGQLDDYIKFHISNILQ